MALYTVETVFVEEHDFLTINKFSIKTRCFNDIVNPSFILVFDYMSPRNQKKTAHLAQDIVQFADKKALGVTIYYATCGFTTQDFDLQTVCDLADRTMTKPLLTYFMGDSSFISKYLFKGVFSPMLYSRQNTKELDWTEASFLIGSCRVRGVTYYWAKSQNLPISGYLTPLMKMA